MDVFQSSLATTALVTTLAAGAATTSQSNIAAPQRDDHALRASVSFINVARLESRDGLPTLGAKPLGELKQQFSILRNKMKEDQMLGDCALATIAVRDSSNSHQYTYLGGLFSLSAKNEIIAYAVQTQHGFPDDLKNFDQTSMGVLTAELNEKKTTAAMEYFSVGSGCSGIPVEIPNDGNIAKAKPVFPGFGQLLVAAP